MTTSAELKAAGNDALRSGSYLAAIEKYTEAIKVAGSSDAVHVLFSNRSAAHVAMGSFNEAIDDGKRCVELKTDWPKGYARVAYAQFRKRLFAAAEKSYKKAAALAKEQGDEGNAAKYAKSAEECAQEDRYVRGIDPRPEVRTTSSTQTSPLLVFQGTFLFLMRSAQILLALGYLLSPLLGGLVSSGRAFGLLLGLSAFSFTFQLLILHGRPRFSTDYASKLFLDYRLQYAIICGTVLLIGRLRPYAFLVFMVIVMEIGFWAEKLHALAPASAASGLARIANWIVPRMLGVPSAEWSSSYTTSTKWSAFNQWATSLSASCEVGCGLLLILELLMPVRNPMLTIIYWQLLRMRTMTSSHVKQVFARLDGAIRPFALKIPILGTGYVYLARVLGRMTTLPKPGEQTASRPRCSIM